MNYRTIKDLQKEIKKLMAAQAVQINADEQTQRALEQSIK